MPTTYDRIDLLEMRLRIAVEALKMIVTHAEDDHDGLTYRELSELACATLKAIDEARLP